MVFGSILSTGMLTVIIVIGVLAFAAIAAAIFYSKRKSFGINGAEYE